ncbi:MAG: ABC transporter permease [Saprospiraceae bacterium]|nr:ABC transporter permease [Saprospiraceae bacterium]
MVIYIIKRLLLILPTWLVISAIVFGLSRCVSGDLVAEKLKYDSESTNNSAISEDIYTAAAIDLGLNRPVFYASVLPRAFPDTLYKILHHDERETLEKLIWQYGNWAAIQDYHVEVKQLLTKMTDNNGIIEPFTNDLKQLLIQYDAYQIDAYLKNVMVATDSTPYKIATQSLVQKFDFVKNHPQTADLYVPSFRWHGNNNQYNSWLRNFISGNFGIAKDDQAVFEKLKQPLSRTLLLGLSTLILGFGIGVPLGVFAANNRRKRRGKWLIKVLFAAYSLPTFWLATLAAVFLTSRFYGLKLFPEVGIGSPPVGASILENLWASSAHFILPILCMSIHPIAVIARQTQAAVQDVLKREYILTAISKGLRRNQVLWRHALRNALMPLATLLAAIIPSLVTGSFAVELIFNLNGMGQTTVSALMSSDWSVVFTVLMLVSIVVLLSNLLSDILYRWLNPRDH